ncbi:hypothetical protein CPB83DRAFT_855044 [Crepidotus variabilis]|uniref:Uncharacterized protein n=1 Tax=Crepidotus variabilis TaxID=179855 RepID=A0A9P6EFK1_9AGAR|nr:hypothetical protein CPB83DRAFT_855044 [Crepidotus variabilis]
MQDALMSPPHEINIGIERHHQMRMMVEEVLDIVELIHIGVDVRILVWGEGLKQVEVVRDNDLVRRALENLRARNR